MLFHKNRLPAHEISCLFVVHEQSANFEMCSAANLGGALWVK